MQKKLVRYALPNTSDRVDMMRHVIHMHKCTHTFIHTYIHMYIRTYTHTYINTFRIKVNNYHNIPADTTLSVAFRRLRHEHDHVHQDLPSVTSSATAALACTTLSATFCTRSAPVGNDLLTQQQQQQLQQAIAQHCV